MRISDWSSDVCSSDLATSYDLPATLPMLPAREDGLAGQNLPRLDVPAKIDGSANFAADIRLPNMVFASIRQGPVGDATLKSINEAEIGRASCRERVCQYV